MITFNSKAWLHLAPLRFTSAKDLLSANDSDSRTYCRSRHRSLLANCNILLSNVLLITEWRREYAVGLLKVCQCPSGNWGIVLYATIAANKNPHNPKSCVAYLHHVIPQWATESSQTVSNCQFTRSNCGKHLHNYTTTTFTIHRNDIGKISSAHLFNTLLRRMKTSLRNLRNKNILTAWEVWKRSEVCSSVQ